MPRYLFVATTMTALVCLISYFFHVQPEVSLGTVLAIFTAAGHYDASNPPKDHG